MVLDKFGVEQKHPTKSTIDTTSNKNLDVTVQMSTATAGGSVVRDTSVCEMI